MEKQMFQDQMQKKVKEIEKVLEQYLPEETGYQKTVIQAMNYSVNAGGKRLRPMLVKETFALFGGEGKLVEPFMAAIEMIHTYSLVHDDLPAMDNDSLRRGRPTTWKVYGDGMGVLAGDGLLNFAFETGLSAFATAPKGDLEKVASALQVLAKKAGIYGMIGGQTADVEAENCEKVSMEQLLFIHEHKTAALIQAAMMMGAILAGADQKDIDAVEKCAYNVGIAFQIQDDILDCIGTEEELGKPIGSDDRNNKQTYVTLHGIEKSKEDVRTLSEEAIALLHSLPGENPFLEQLILELIYRTK